MSEVVADSDLQQTVASCSDGFQRVVAQLNRERPEATEFGSVRAVWIDYYFGEFARFDALLRARIEASERNMGAYMPLSISHHNLHRLMEVIHLEIGDRALETTRIPERILDLFEVCNRLSTLLAETRNLSSKASYEHINSMARNERSR